MKPPRTRVAARLANRKRSRKTKRYLVLITLAAVILGAGVAVIFVKPWASGRDPSTPLRYLGVHEPDAPGSYSGVDQFAEAIGRQPDLVTYYSPWLEPFQVGFAATAAQKGAVTLVQLDPMDVSVAAIASGHYDAYLRSYAAAVEAFPGKVILSFGHEMNGRWYSWGYQHTSATVFVKAWRHIVTLFRTMGAKNVIWLWTVNIIDQNPFIPSPNRWWPGSRYVTWVGIDGYYYQPSEMFAQVFGPTIVDVRGFTHDPILIAETAAEPNTGQAAKINDLFSGVRTYGLLGFVWFDQNSEGRIWRVSGSEAFAAFRHDVRESMRPPVPRASPSGSEP